MSRLALAALALGGLAAPLHAQDFDRSKVPAAGPAPALQRPDVTRRTLGNGLELWIVSRHELPVVNASLIIRAGAANDGTRFGIATVTAGLLDEGSTTRSGPAFARAVDQLGIQLFAGAGIDRTTITLQTLSSTADSAFALLGELVARPAFSAQEVERDRRLRLTALRARQDQPTVVATRVFQAEVYGEDASYGHPEDGTVATVGALTREEIAAFYRTWYRPGNAVLVIVGDVTTEHAMALATSALGTWEAGPVPADPAPAAPAPRPATVYLVDKPKAAQSEVRIGSAGAARTSPDYYALTVLNTILGGQFSSRINLNIREDKGYTYGARSAFSFLRGPGPFMASGGVMTARTDSSVREFMRELVDIGGSRPVTAEELRFASGMLVRSYPRRLETNAGVASELADLAFFGFPPAELVEWQQKIAAVSLADVHRAATQYLRPEHFVTVVVGDLAAIESGLAALGYGPVVVVDAEGNPVQH